MGTLPPVCRLASDEVKADKASHGVRHNHSLPAIVLLHSMLNQIPHHVKMPSLQRKQPHHFLEAGDA